MRRGAGQGLRHQSPPKPADVYVCGNGGMRPQHAVLLAEDIDKDVIRYLDRFLMFYTPTADRLERTAPWFTSSMAASTT